jgi:hypothetical protein
MSPKVNMAKYMPLNLRVKAPTRKARQKLARPPMTITIGRGNTLPSIAAAYMPTPKKAAGASDIYPVGPENIAQLTERTIYIKTLVNMITVYGGA